MTTIKLKNGSGAPLAGDLVQGEPALDLTNKRLYTEDSGGTVIEVGTNPGEDVTFADNRKAIFGAGSDLEIYHDGTKSVIHDAGTGNLLVRASNLSFANAAWSANYLTATDGAGVSIYYDNSQKLTTTSTGIDVTGTVVSDGLFVSANGQVVPRITSADGLGDAGLRFYSGDTYKGQIGWDQATNTLGIYPPTTSSIPYLTVNSTGIDVTGTVTADNISVDSGRFLTAQGAQTTGYGFNGDGDSAMYQQISNQLQFSTANTERLRIASSGDISFYEDTGTTAKFFWDSSLESLGVGTNSVVTYQSGPALNIGDTSASYAQLNFTTATNGVQYIGFGDATSGNGRYQGLIQFNHSTNSMGFGTGASTTSNLIIDSSGNVAINRSTASAKLDVNLGASGDIAIFRGSSSDTFTIDSDGSGINLDTRNTTAGLTFQIQGADKMTLDASGNLLVGATTTASGPGGIMLRPNVSNGSAVIDLDRTSTTATSEAFLVRNGGTVVGKITYNNTSTSYVTSSDERLKDNITDAPSASDDIDAIQVRSFDWKADGSHQKYGMVAQELQSVAPEAVSGDADSDDMMGVDYSKLVPMLVKEIQSLRARVAQLEGAN